MCRFSAIARYLPLTLSLILLSFGIYLYIKIPHLDDLYNTINNGSRPGKPENSFLFTLSMPLLLFLYGTYVCFRGAPTRESAISRFSSGKGFAIAIIVYVVIFTVSLSRYYQLYAYYNISIP